MDKIKLFLKDRYVNFKTSLKDLYKQSFGIVYRALILAIIIRAVFFIWPL